MMTPCPSCGAGSPLLFAAKDRNRRISDREFSYHVCPDCSLIFLSPVPEDLGGYYPTDYYAFPASMRQFESGAEPERYKIELVQRFAAGGRLLEIGPSNGNFTLLAKMAGFEVEAIEMDERCCLFLEESLGIQVFCDADPAAALDGADPYQVVALWHVIEHIPDPWGTLAAIAEKTRPEGVVVIAAPNPGSLQFRVLGRLWPHLDAPRHLALIPRQLLVAHMRRLGFELAWETTTDRGGIGWNLFGWEFFFRNTLSFLDFLGPMIVHGISRLLGRAVGGLLGGIERRGCLGSAYTLVFRKE